MTNIEIKYNVYEFSRQILFFIRIFVVVKSLSTNQLIRNTIIWSNFDQLFAKIQQTHLQKSLNQYLIAKMISFFSNFHWKQLSFDHFLLFQQIAHSFVLFFIEFFRFWWDVNKKQKFSFRFRIRFRETFRFFSHTLLYSVFFYWIFRILMKHRQQTKNHLFKSTYKQLSSSSSQQSS